MKKIILDMLRTQGFKHDPNFGITLASGKKSDFYIDCKPVLLRGPTIKDLGHIIFSQIVNACVNEGKIVQPSHVVGVAMGGIPLATAVSIASLGTWMPLDSLIVRKEIKAHGTSKLIEGHVDEWTNAVIVEDVVTTGSSSLKTMEILKLSGVNVLGIFTIVDRLEGGRQALESSGLYFSSLFTRDDFVIPIE